VQVTSVTDAANPALRIVWEKPQKVRWFDMPAGATVFTRERWTGAPLAAALRHDGRLYLWVAAGLGDKGYERFPYLAQALAEMGERPPAAARDLWAFADTSYRTRVDVEYLAERWRRSGVAALHVAAWHYWEPDAGRDEWLGRLVEACHRRAILVYAWVEFPHVSERFWQDHPEWREKTASGQDAHLDWRKLMNLADPACAAEAARGLERLAARFDWDGVNLGELYFESLEGYLNPARFTPFNALVRAQFAAEAGFDPKELYQRGARRYHLTDARPMRRFLDFRAALARRLQEEWLGRLTKLRKTKPWLDLALTHIDDRFDTTMRDKLGADAARLLPAAASAGATFVVEDPATVWDLGPERYTELARRYAALGAPKEQLAVDINVVERYQDVYPTKQQTGSELFQLIHSAAAAFQRVMLYFENSILAPDWPLVGAAAAAARVTGTAEGLTVESGHAISVRFPGCATLDGNEWPAGDEESVLVPAGRHTLRRCEGPAGRVLRDFNGTLLEASATAGRLRITYRSRSRAIALLDGREAPVLLAPGTHAVELETSFNGRPAASASAPE
jgi:hypothetical protein